MIFFSSLGQARISLVDLCSQKLMAMDEVPKDMEEKVKLRFLASITPANIPVGFQPVIFCIPIGFRPEIVRQDPIGNGQEISKVPFNNFFSLSLKKLKLKMKMSRKFPIESDGISI
jgi:hypothetical protein